MNNSKMVKIKELGQIITGKTPPTKNKEFFEGIYPFITPTDIKNYDIRLLDKTDRFLSGKWLEKCKNYSLPPKSICYVSIGSTVGKMCMTKELSFSNQQINSIICESSKVNTDFLFYKLKSESPRLISIAKGKGSGKYIINKTEFENIKIEIPELMIQHKIASILSAYDELIENNNRRIEILEEMAETIYKEWFVHFRFPGHEKVEMVDSELGKIPEGWEVKKLNDFVDFIKGFEPGTKNYFNEKIPNSIPFLRVGDLNDRNSQIWIDKNITKGKILKKKDIALTLDGTPGIVRMGYYGAYSSGIQKVVIKDEKITWAFLYLLLKSNQIQDTIKAHSSGTTIVHAGSSKKYLKFLLPKTEIMFSFEKRFSILLYLKLFLEEKNRNLKESRDLLLPKLISGKIDVSDINIKTEEKK